MAANVSPNVANAMRGFGASCAARWNVRSRYGVSTKPAQIVGNANASGSVSRLGTTGPRPTASGPVRSGSTPPGRSTTSPLRSVTTVPAVRQNALPRRASTKPPISSAIGAPVAATVHRAGATPLAATSLADDASCPMECTCASHPAAHPAK